MIDSYELGNAGILGCRHFLFCFLYWSLGIQSLG